MMLRLVLLLSFFWTGLAGANPKALEGDHKGRIRVRIANNTQFAVITGRNLQVQVKKSPMRNVAVDLETTVKVSLTPNPENGGLTWLVRKGRQRSAYANRALFIWADLLKVDGHEFKGEVVLWPKGSESLDVIAVLDLEDYIKRVLPGEMIPSWPLEALKAQAVAARSYALAQRRSRETLHFDVEATIEDQVFQAASPNFPEWAREKVNQAVEETRGQVLVDADLEVAKTYFHADCGGGTDESHQIWGDGGRSGTARDRSCPLSPRAKWQMEISRQELGRRLKALVPVAEDLLDVRPLKFLKSGRVKTLWIQGTGGGGAEVTSEEFRRAVGFSEFRSTRFTISRSDKQFKFNGIGHGHGVGMCQWGSREMAKQGKGYKAILKHYFSNLLLQNTYDRTSETVALQAHETQ